MRKDILEKVSGDLLSILPLISRASRRHIVGSAVTRADLNITPHHLEIMKLLDEDGEMSVSQIGFRLQIHRAQMTKLIDRLVSLKLVAKKVDKVDRRTFNIALTDRARASLKKNESNLTSTIEELMSNLTDEELENLEFSLTSFRNILLKSLVGNLNSGPPYRVSDHGGWIVKIPDVNSMTD